MSPINPRILFLAGIVLILLSYAGTVEVLDEDVVVHPKSYAEWVFKPNIGATIHVSVSLDTNIAESNTGLLEAYIMYSEDRLNYIDGRYDEIHLPPSQRTFVDERWPGVLKFPVHRPSNLYVILNNKIRVDARDLDKSAHINVYVTKPYGILLYPGVIVLGIGVVMALRQGSSTHREKETYQ